MTGNVASAPQGVRHVTAADKGLVTVPMLAPHLRFDVVNSDRVLLVAEGVAVELNGRCFGSLLPLLDGSRTRRQVLAELENGHSPVEVQTALVRLASSGFVVSAEFNMAPELAAFWSALGASPSRAQECLGATPVEVRGDDGALATYLAGLGAVVGADAPGLRLVVTDDYLSQRHEAFHAAGGNGRPWLLVKPTDARALFGPVFGRDAACWRCFSRRLSATSQLESFLRGKSARPGSSPLAAAAYALAAVEIAKWIVFGEEAPLHDRAMSVDAATGTGFHHAPRWPQCPDCGVNADPAPVPPQLGASANTLRNSGGTRSIHPEETLRRLRHLVDPVTGIVTDLRRIGDPSDPWFFVYLASFAPTVLASSYAELRFGIVRGSSAGKGSTPAQAEASALCEAIERYSGILQGGEVVLRRRMDEFPDGAALPPNAIERFSDVQFEQPPDVARLRSRPVPFDASQALDWTPVWSLTAEAWRYIPTRLLYYASPVEGEANQFLANSNGCASGNTFEEAILQGFFELVERDAFACWWYNQIRVPAVDLASFDNQYLAEAPARYERAGREMWMLDVTHDLGIPVFVALSRCDSGGEDRILYGVGCHFDPLVAASRAVCELNQIHLAGTLPQKQDSARADEWLRTARIADKPYLAPDPATSLRKAPPSRAPGTGDHRDDIALCRRIVEDAGMEFLVLDQTRADIGLPVARVIVPGLRHFWPRFGSGRLYDVPVAMGWRAAPLAEAEFNPDEPVF